MAKRAKTPKVDGLGPDDLKRIHKALGQVRKWSYPVRLAKARAMGKDGFPRCENPKCPKRGKPVPSVQADHIHPIGEVGGPNYIKLMFVGSEKPNAFASTATTSRPRSRKPLSSISNDIYCSKIVVAIPDRLGYALSMSNDKCERCGKYSHGATLCNACQKEALKKDKAKKKVPRRKAGAAPCKRCSYFYGLLQMIRETNVSTKLELLHEKGRKTPRLFLNDMVTHFQFRADLIDDLCLDADKEVPKEPVGFKKDRL